MSFEKTEHEWSRCDVSVVTDGATCAPDTPAGTSGTMDGQLGLSTLGRIVGTSGITSLALDRMAVENQGWFRIQGPVGLSNTGV